MNGDDEMKKLIGVEPVNYTSKKTGGLVTGVRIYVQEDMVSPSIGVKVQEHFINGARIEDYPLGSIDAVLLEPTFGNNFRCTGVLYTRK